MLSSVVPVVFNTTIGFVFLIQQGQQRTTFIFRLRQQPLSTESVSDSTKLVALKQEIAKEKATR